MTDSAPLRCPASTYRVQLGRAFRFTDARELVPYLERLGVAACYSSPSLKATPGSAHGYDIVDHAQLNPELGTEAEYADWCGALRAAGLGHLVDFVPNHMSADPMENKWWRDVLENGPSSPYARYFDIDWDPVKPELKGKVLLPLLGDQYGRVIERGELQLRFREGGLSVTYGDRDLPINPRQAPRVLELDLDRLEQRMGGDPARLEFLSVLTALRNLPAYTEDHPARIAERQREKEVARVRLARLTAESPGIREHVEAAVRTANGRVGEPDSFDRLHALLEHQAYRLAYWRTAIDEINYRRFFDINELVGLRMEEEDVFAAAHQLVGRMIAAGQLTGLRVDHPDGLFDPCEYLRRLERLTQTAPGLGEHADGPLYLVVEKILSDGESLRSDWPVAGTTGYGFLNLVAGLFIDSRQVQRLRRVYAQLTGHQAQFEEVAYESKCTIMQTAMASELNVLAHALSGIAERDRRVRDFTLNSCQRVLREVAACFPVYRTYVSSRGVDPFDRTAVEQAIRLARRRNPLMAGSIFRFLQDILLSGPPDAASSDAAAQERHRFAMRVQQFTSPVQAKGVEDTAFYRYHVLISANEVGGYPGRLGVTPADFHRANSDRLESWRGEMLATATHDTKRGEDARVRISVISEMPESWRRAASEWMRINSRHRTEVAGIWAPDRNDEYFFYQTLLGIWPPEPARAPIVGAAEPDLVERLCRYLLKAVREAKVHTSWIDEDQAYGSAVVRFVRRVLGDRSSGRFLPSFVPVARRVARAGMVNSLAQLVLKLASPGVADFYQGSELWDLSLADPDNRRPVDFGLRRRLVDELTPLVQAVAGGRASEAEVIGLFEHWTDGRIKLFVTMAGLHFRRRHPRVAIEGAYVPLPSEGPAADCVVAFARPHASGTLVAATPRLVLSVTQDNRLMPVGDEPWGGTHLRVPPAVPADRFHNLLTGEFVQTSGQGDRRFLSASHVFRTCPVALLWSPAPSQQRD